MKSKILLAASGAVLLASLAIANLSSAPNAVAAPQQDREEIEKIVREYLLEHPEVIFEAVDVYQKREAARAQEVAAAEIRNNLPTFQSASAGHAIGASAEDADVIVVEFYDYNCGVCRSAMDMVFDLADQDGVRVVLQEMPVLSQQSYELALTSLSLVNTDNFVEFHKEMFNSNGQITEAYLNRVAKKVGLNRAELDEILSDTDKRAQLEDKLQYSMEIGRSIGVDGTPGFVIATPDGEYVKFISGFYEPSIREAVEEAKRS